jgi:hypothetical protein
LLRQARAAGFDVFVTGDQNRLHQQNLSQSGLFIIVLVAASNALEDLLPRVPAALDAIANARAGETVRLEN